MEPEVYRAMAAHEDRHWWFVGRRAVICALLDRVRLPEGASILEAGCGTGGNLYMLAERGTVSAFEPHEEAREFAAEKALAGVLGGSLPSDVPFEPGSFDLVAAFDVLEHVEDDGPALTTLVSMARPGGWIVVTVPAIQRLWGSHDRRLHHVRRYDPARLRRLAADAGVDIVYATWFNTLLAPVAMTYRVAERIVGRDLGDQERMPPGPINRVLSWAFGLERHVVGRVPLPIGLSIGMLLKRPLE